jgi:hypothetical protein
METPRIRDTVGFAAGALHRTDLELRVESARLVQFEFGPWNHGEFDNGAFGDSSGSILQSEEEEGRPSQKDLGQCHGVFAQSIDSSAVPHETFEAVECHAV